MGKAHEKGLTQGFGQGLEKGLERGLEEGMEKIAINMLRVNKPLAEISLLTDLYEHIIVNLRKSFQ